MIFSIYTKKVRINTLIYELIYNVKKNIYLKYSICSFILITLGIRQIGSLDEFVNVKCLYLQNNVIGKIENLAHLKKLTLLFLNDNCISKIENLDGLATLDKIDLSRNNIKVVENLGKIDFKEQLPNLLKTLNLYRLLGKSDKLRFELQWSPTY
jgi:hypothetical protein